ncbi:MULTISPECIES: hypothetical protein [unclassified Streptomyces]|uniref:hypothetical protein n=1 Tax=unclassified Streptomyces TaxID=2593676 RepID=UPI00226E24A3|nr:MULTISPECIES: hypothetical protein [unclassified Streptomyces]MCY0918289.1 hypothetical protein [Streptomyces sp. H27-G5]MCY0957450.1 hypothetical protein [Streptomyces sp. H27-H5]
MHEHPSTTKTITPATWHRPEFQGREEELIHLAAGADLAGVTRSAVSNWAIRHPDFPKLVLETGPESRRTKYVCEAEFMAFAQKRRTEVTRKRKPSPHRPGAVIDAERLEHCERQVARLRDLEMRQVAKPTATRAALKVARSRLASAEATSRGR